MGRSLVKFLGYSKGCDQDGDMVFINILQKIANFLQIDYSHVNAKFCIFFTFRTSQKIYWNFVHACLKEHFWVKIVCIKVFIFFSDLKMASRRSSLLYQNETWHFSFLSCWCVADSLLQIVVDFRTRHFCSIQTLKLSWLILL